MNATAWTMLLACLGELLLLVLVVLRGSRTPLAGPLLALCVVVFGWNFCGLAWEVSGHEEWRWLDITFSPFTTAIALHLILAFTGRRRQLRLARVAAYAFSSAMSAIGPLALLLPGFGRWYDHGLVPLIHLAGVAAVMSLVLGLLVLHFRSSQSSAERARTALLLGAMALAAVLASTELLVDLGFALPRLGALGVLTGNALMVLVALRLRLFDRALTVLDLAYAALLAVFVVSLFLVVLQWLGTQTAVGVVASVTVTLLLLSFQRQISLGMRADRVQLQDLAFMGRMSAQLAHDLKNPLSALRGAAQFLQIELARGRSPSEQETFLALIVEQADRMQRVVDEYQRLGRMELSRTEVDPNALVSEVLALQAFAAGAGIEVRSELGPELPTVSMDRELVSNALENLLRNAFQALPAGGQVRVATRVAHPGDDSFVVLSVADTGEGMDPRTRERAFEDFFTTRPEGSGLGLGFVRRVAVAHGGRVLIDSRERRGTRVEMWFPVRADEDAAA